MKFFLYIVFFLIFISRTYSQQDWPPNGAIWYYQYSPYGFGPPPLLSFMTITVIGDTTINGQLCKKLLKSDYLGNCTDEEKFSFLYSDSNKVFWYNTSLDTFTLLYDFNAQANDSWDILVFGCATLTIVVDSTGYEVVNQDTLKVLYTSWHGVIIQGQKGKIIERIGSSLYLLPPLYFCYSACDDEYFSGLRCYEDTILGLYESGLNPCDTVWLGNENNVQIDNLRVYPNPTTNEIILDGIEQPTEFCLYDLYGKEVFVSQLTTGTNRVELKNVSSGIYIYKLFGELKTNKLFIRK